MGRHKRYEASEQQEYEEAKIVSRGHANGSKRSRPDLTETIPIAPTFEFALDLRRDAALPHPITQSRPMHTEVCNAWA